MAVTDTCRASSEVMTVAPGVRIEVRKSHTPAIPEDDPSVVGFVGLASRGPHTGAFPVGSWAEFRDRFGGPSPGAYLAEAARGFFSNGGRRAYVAKVGPPGGTIVPRDFLGARGAGDGAAGIESILSIDEIGLIAVPDLTSALKADQAVLVYRFLIDRVERRGDRLVILDPPRGIDPHQIGEWSADLSSSSAALYFPWVRVASDATTPVPPSGHVAGTYARIDRRDGPHRPPANAILAGAVDLDTRLDEQEACAVAASRINVLRAFPGRGVRAFGARTLQGDPVNVRRLMITVAKAIRCGTGWVAFEPQTDRVRTAIVRSVTAYLSRLWRGGALAGAAAEEAFYVRCDGSIPDASAGTLVCEIGIAPVRPAEFIVLRIVHRHEGGLAPTEGEEGNLAR